MLKSPEPELVVDNPYVRLYFHRDSRIVHHQMVQHVEGSAFRDVLTRGAELLEKTRATKWLSDDRVHLRMVEADEQWAKAIWFPRVQAAGWKHWAIVKPESAIGALNLSRISQNFAKLGVNARIHGDFDEALAWLKAC
jgi:hypothetical protein